jgi:SAM-dependent methyltransferase
MMHGRTLHQRYNYIARLAGESVIDVGCGTGKLVDYLPENSNYLGIDLNDNFLRHAKKRGRNVLKHDALTFDRFGEFDACVIMDLLHHINPRHEEFIERVLRDVRKRVIICEPFEVPGRNPITKNLVRIIDDDGINRQDEMWMDKKTLLNFYHSFDPASIEEVGQAMIAVIDKK